MVISWLKRAVVFFALSSVFVFVLSQPAYAAKETYFWEKYDTIVAGNGAFIAISPDRSESRFYFRQDPENPKVYKASGGNCESIVLTIGSVASSAKVSVQGACDDFKDYATEVVIRDIPAGVESVKKEARQLEERFTKKDCGGSDQEGALCRTAAKEKYEEESKKCQASHDYTNNPTKGNEFLDCLATALGVERGDDKEEDEEDKDGTTCAIPDPGWAVCQIVEFTAWLTDHTFQLLRPFLEFEPLSKEIGVRPGETSVYQAWQSMRDIANVALVIAFFFIIYSYLTGIGIANYDIKKSFPRLIIAAILINISFFAAGLLVDISNIFGRSIQTMTTQFGDSVQSESSVYSNWTTTTQRVVTITATDEEFTKENTSHMTNKELEAIGLPPLNSDEAGQPSNNQTKSSDEDEDEIPIPTVMVMNGIVLTGTAVLYANLAVLVPLMVVALFSMFVTLMVLLLRQALVIVLVVIAPLAIAAYILPGTKQYFSKWQSTFVQLLMLYPVIALIYASSVIASSVIRESALNNGQTLLAIFSMAIMVVPLFVTPLILKFGGGILAQFGGTVQGMISKPRGMAMSAAQDFRKSRKTLQRTRTAHGLVGVGRFRTRLGGDGKLGAVNNLRPGNVWAAVRMGQQHKERRATRAAEEARARDMESYLSGVKNADLRRDLATTLLTQVGDVELKNISADAARLSTLYDKSELRRRAIEGSDGDGVTLSDEERRAAQMAYMNTATLEDVHELIENSHEMSARQRADLVNLIREKGFTSQAPHLSAKVLNNIAAGKPGSNNVNKMIADGANEGRFSAGNRLTGANQDTLRRLHTAMSSGHVDAARVREISSQAKSELAHSRATDSNEVLRQIARMAP